LRSPSVSSSDVLPPELVSSRVVVVSDFNCPYCFTLNEWLNRLDVASRVWWVGVEHKAHLPSAFAAFNHPDDLQTLRHEVADVQRRAPDLAVQLPPVWVNSHAALLLQAAVEAEEPGRAAALRTAIFRHFWQHSDNIADADVLADCLEQAGLPADPARFLDAQQLQRITGWWSEALDRIPCLLAPSGARHLGLQDLAAVEAFVHGALHEPPPGPSCR
jgi:protein-disulfide isomerase-like protein with CxxC motif